MTAKNSKICSKRDNNMLTSINKCKNDWVSLGIVQLRHIIVDLITISLIVIERSIC